MTTKTDDKTDLGALQREYLETLEQLRDAEETERRARSEAVAVRNHLVAVGKMLDEAVAAVKDGRA